MAFLGPTHWPRATVRFGSVRFFLFFSNFFDFVFSNRTFLSRGINYGDHWTWSSFGHQVPHATHRRNSFPPLTRILEKKQLNSWNSSATSRVLERKKKTEKLVTYLDTSVGARRRLRSILSPSPYIVFSHWG